MDPISNIDRVTALLQQKLRERLKSDGKSAEGKPDRQSTNAPAGIEAARAIAAMEGVPDHQRRRAFIQSILAEHLGAALVNDARFQQIVARVAQAIDDDDGASQLLTSLMDELRR